MKQNKLSWWEIVARVYLAISAITGSIVIWLWVGGSVQIDWIQTPSLEQRVERLEEINEMKRLCDLRNGYWQEEYREGDKTTFLLGVGSGFCKVNREYYTWDGVRWTRTESNKEIKLK